MMSRAPRAKQPKRLDTRRVIKPVVPALLSPIKIFAQSLVTPFGARMGSPEKKKREKREKRDVLRSDGH